MPPRPAEWPGAAQAPQAPPAHQAGSPMHGAWPRAVGGRTAKRQPSVTKNGFFAHPYSKFAIFCEAPGQHAANATLPVSDPRPFGLPGSACPSQIPPPRQRPAGQRKLPPYGHHGPAPSPEPRAPSSKPKARSAWHMRRATAAQPAPSVPVHALPLPGRKGRIGRGGRGGKVMRFTSLFTSFCPAGSPPSTHSADAGRWRAHAMHPAHPKLPQKRPSSQVPA